MISCLINARPWDMECGLSPGDRHRFLIPSPQVETNAQPDSIFAVNGQFMEIQNSNKINASNPEEHVRFIVNIFYCDVGFYFF